MKKSSKFYLVHIIDCINDIEKYTEGFSEIEFKDDPKTQDAVIRKLEIIGEAVKNIPEALKQEHPEISWKKISGTRDVLIHEYFGVDIDIVWIVVIKDLPVLKRQTKKILEKIK